MTKRMGKVTSDLTISADGYSAGVNQTEERPFGDDDGDDGGGDGSGAELHQWMFDTPNENRADLDQMTAAEAFIMGRNMFGPVPGGWDGPWNGWWGDVPPFLAPVFVLTHHPASRSRWTAKRRTTSSPMGSSRPWRKRPRGRRWRCRDPGRRRHH